MSPNLKSFLSSVAAVAVGFMIANITWAKIVPASLKA